MLSAVSRGNTMIYWYTYGPDYKKGDSFSQDRATLALTSKAAHLLAQAEEALYGATWAAEAEIAVVKPETTQRWMNLAGNPPHLAAAWENAKWIYSALAHSHLPVDPIDETMLATDDLSKYKLIYVSGSHVTRQAAEALAQYVARGGTLYTSGWGLARDEANQPLAEMQTVLGLLRRGEPQIWYQVQLYGASRLEPYDDPARQLAPVPEGAGIVGGTLLEAAFRPVVGREVLPGRRRFVAAPALELTRPVVDVSDPLVQGVPLESPDGRHRCVTLANWGYAVTAIRQDAGGRETPVAEHVPVEKVEIKIRTSRAISSATSCMLDKRLELAPSEGAVRIHLPRLEEGDVLLIQ